MSNIFHHLSHCWEEPIQVDEDHIYQSIGGKEHRFYYGYRSRQGKLVELWSAWTGDNVEDFKARLKNNGRDVTVYELETRLGDRYFEEE